MIKTRYTVEDLKRHSCKLTALLMATLTKPYLNSSSYKLCTSHTAISGQLQLLSLFLLPRVFTYRSFVCKPDCLRSLKHILKLELEQTVPQT